MSVPGTHSALSLTRRSGISGLEAGDNLAVVGLELGPLGVKFGHALGAHVTVLSHSPGKRPDAGKLGADDFITTEDEDIFIENAGRFNYFLDRSWPSTTRTPISICCTTTASWCWSACQMSRCRFLLRPSF
jgi:D-arabinose 1-dehydrogenase-like Zn-dependent alcohol dehydrogenase